MIQISNLTKEYGKTVIFSNLNYTFEPSFFNGLTIYEKIAALPNCVKATSTIA